MKPYSLYDGITRAGKFGLKVIRSRIVWPEAALFLIAILFSGRAHAASLTFVPSASDGTVEEHWAMGSTTSTTSLVGEQSGGTEYWGRATILVFAIPKVALGEQIASANLTVNVASLDGAGGINFNGDLYSLGFSTSPSISGSDYYNGTYASSSTATALQQHFFSWQTTKGAGPVSTSTTGSSNLAADLNEQLSQGAAQGDYCFLRLNPDFTSSSDDYYGYPVDMTESSSPPSLTATTMQKPQLGRVLFEYWTSIPGVSLTGTSVSSLQTATQNFTVPPNYREYPTVLEIPEYLKAFNPTSLLLNSPDENSGDRMRCYFYPPTSGVYTFYLAASSQGELFFTGTSSPPANYTTPQITANSTAYRAWASQTYTTPYLYAGQPYYLETQHKQGSSTSENLSVGWQPPGVNSAAYMPATYCAPYDPGQAFTTGAAAIANATQSHPRLLISPASMSRLIALTSGTQYTMGQDIIGAANYLTESTTPLITAPAPGQTLINAARNLQTDMYRLGVASYISAGSYQGTHLLYAQRAYNELHAAALWGTAAGSPAGNWDVYQYLDVAEMCHAFAIGYDWFYPQLSPAQRIEICNDIDNLALSTALSQVYAANSPNAWAVNNSGNWEIVCNGGLTMGALAIMNDDATDSNPATVLQDAMNILANDAPPNNAIQNFGPDGAEYESPGYWSFAAEYLSLLYGGSETALATCFNLDQDPLASIGAQGVYQVGPLNRLYAYGDVGNDLENTNPQMQYFGLKFNQPTYSWRQLQDVWFIPAAQSPPATQYPDGRDMIWYDSRGDTSINGNTYSPASSTTPLPPSTYFRNNTSDEGGGLVYLRAPSLSTLNAWTDPNALFLGMRTGYIAGGHCQLEMGSFTFDAMGVRWAYDLGAENYSCNGMGNLTPSNDIDYADGLQNRWQYYRNQAQGNNTLVMVSTAGSPQVYMPDQSLSSAVPVIAFDANPLTPMAVVDLTSAYTAVPNVLPGSTSVTKALRGTRFISDPGFPQAMQIQDEITNSAQAVNVTWTMHTQVPLGSIALSSGGTTATLISGNSGLVMTIVSPVGATFATPAVTPTETAPAGQASNAGVNTLSTTIQVPANAAKTLTINMCPYSTGGAIPTGLTLPTAALSTWK